MLGFIHIYDIENEAPSIHLNKKKKKNTYKQTKNFERSWFLVNTSKPLRYHIFHNYHNFLGRRFVKKIGNSGNSSNVSDTYTVTEHTRKYNQYLLLHLSVTLDFASRRSFFFFFKSIYQICFCEKFLFFFYLIYLKRKVKNLKRTLSHQFKHSLHL